MFLMTTRMSGAKTNVVHGLTATSMATVKVTMVGSATTSNLILKVDQMHFTTFVHCIGRTMHPVKRVDSKPL